MGATGSLMRQPKGTCILVLRSNLACSQKDDKYGAECDSKETSTSAAHEGICPDVQYVYLNLCIRTPEWKCQK